MRQRHSAYCPACDARVERAWAWSAERWMSRHERQCPELKALLGRRH